MFCYFCISQYYDCSYFCDCLHYFWHSPIFVCLPKVMQTVTEIGTVIILIYASNKTQKLWEFKSGSKKHITGLSGGCRKRLSVIIKFPRWGVLVLQCALRWLFPSRAEQLLGRTQGASFLRSSQGSGKQREACFCVPPWYSIASYWRWALSASATLPCSHVHSCFP